MRAISVASPCNGSGKTSLILAILKAFPNTFAVTKFTTIYGDEQFCPAKDQDCACHRLRGDYTICTDETVLSQPDTDTGRIWRGGGLKTFWCVSRPEGYPGMLEEFLHQHLKPGVPLLMEGTTIARHLRPQLRLFIVNPFLPESWWKGDSEEFLLAADYVIVNRHSDGSDKATDARSTLRTLDAVREKCLEGSLDSLDRWKDVRPYRAIADLLCENE